MDNFENKVEVFDRKTHFQERLRTREKKAGLTDAEVKYLDREEVYRRLENIVGNTMIREISLPNDNLLIQKDETINPTESHYDRCYINLLRELEVKGDINPGDVLLETTSGSAGVSFSWICKKLGYRSVVFMPSYVPEPRIVEVKSLATEVYLNNDREKYLLACAEDMMSYFKDKERRKKVKMLGKRMRLPNHSQNTITANSFSKIADEASNQLKGREIDYFIGGIGNGSTLLGIGGRAKELYPRLKVVAYEPVSACPYYKKYYQKWGKMGLKFVENNEIPGDFSFHSMPGTGGYGNIDFPFMNVAIENNIIDDIIPVSDKNILYENKYRYNNELPQEMQLGNTSIVSRFIAEKMAEKVIGKTFLVLAYDRADRYGEPKYVK